MQSLWGNVRRVFCPLLHLQLESCETPIVQVKPKVSFGPAVTPELIDKTLPPDTPVRKGSVPVGEMEVLLLPFNDLLPTCNIISFFKVVASHRAQTLWPALLPSGLHNCFQSSK